MLSDENSHLKVGGFRPARLFMIRLLLCTTVIFPGCWPGPHVSAPVDDAWVITALRQEHSHDTVESEDGNLFHVHFLTVELTRNGTTVSLLYENELPSDWTYQVADHCRIAGLESAEYCEEWHGYWLHQVELSKH